MALPKPKTRVSETQTRVLETQVSLSRRAAAQQEEEEVSFCKQFLAKTRDMCVQRIKFYDSTDPMPRDMSKYFWKLYLVGRLICHNSGRKNKPNPEKSHKNLDLIS